MLDNAGVGIEPDALDRLVALIGGYPYFLHLYGKHAWLAGDGESSRSPRWSWRPRPPPRT
jgi:hypothetical protein